MTVRAIRFTAIVVTLSALAKGASVADWTQWRGPNRDGQATTFAVPAMWPAKLDRKWKVEVGIGHASPLIAGDAIFVFSREGENEIVRRLNLANGKDVWRDSYPAPYEMNPAARGHGKGPKSTPTLSGGRLFAFGISGILSAYDAKSGKVLWRKEYSKQYAKTSPEFGEALSPLVDKDTVFVHIGGKDQGALVALDARSGETKWSWKGDGPSYASPMLFTIGGVRQVITQTQKMIVGIGADSGKLLWSLPFTTPFEQNIVTPIQSGNLLIFGGLQQPTFAARLDRSGSGNTWTPARVWETRDASFYMNTPVLADGKLYGLSHKSRGQLVSIDAATGKLLWSDEGRMGDNASVLAAGSAILVLPVDGTLRIYRPKGDTLVLDSKYTVAETPTWAVPALDRNHIVVKDQTSVILWDVPLARQ